MNGPSITGVNSSTIGYDNAAFSYTYVFGGCVCGVQNQLVIPYNFQVALFCNGP